MNQELYNDLLKLRQELKDAGRMMQGRAPLVCNDDALYEIAELCPKKLNDFGSIPGIGKTFIDNYGELFLEVIKEHQETPTEKAVQLNDAAADTLKELEKKLVSINRRNRLLYMPKIAAKYAFDLYHPTKNYAESIITGNGSFVTISNIYNDDTNDLQALTSYKKIVTLLREINKDLRDKGQNDLYIGYPFVIGCIPGENFDVRAPLALFPITAERSATSIQLALDDSRDIIYNNTLILANYKFNNISKPLPLDTIEQYNKDTFIEELISFYKEHDISIKGSQGELRKFTEYAAAEFPQFKSGELKIEHCAVLGKYPIRSNALQKDFDEILKNNEINSLLNSLLLNADDYDYYSDSYAGEEEIAVSERDLEISEHDLVYINELNSSQEAVLAAIDKLDELVVQGPPGTGKSQTITSLISEFVSQEKNSIDGF